MASDNPSALLQLATAAEEVERAGGDVTTPAEDTASAAETSPLLLLQQQLTDLRASLLESQAREAQRDSLMEQLTLIVAAQAPNNTSDQTSSDQTPNNAPDRSSSNRLVQREIKNVKPPTGTYEMSSVEYRTFCRDWRDYQRLTQDCDSAIVTHMRLTCGAQLRQAIDTIHGDKWQGYSVDRALQEIGQITKHSSNPAVARKRFHGLAQTPTEPIREFVVRCRQTAADCRFMCPTCDSDLTDWMLADQVTCGVQSEALQQELLQKHGSFSSFEALRSYCEAHESAYRAKQELSLSSATSVAAVVTPADTAEDIRQPDPDQAPELAARMSAHTRQKHGKLQQPAAPCSFCGRAAHTKGRQGCPALDKFCSQCGKKGHFSTVCRGKTTLSSVRVGRNVIAGVGRGLPRLQLTVTHPGSRKSSVFSAIADTGAEVSVMSRSHLTQLGLSPKHLKKTARRLQHAAGGGLQVLGTIRMQICLQDRQTTEDIFVVAGVDDMFLSLSACRNLSVVHADFPCHQIGAISDANPPEGADMPADKPHHLPDRPNQLPFPPTEGNIPKLEAWLKEHFSDSTFNTTRQPLPAMSGPPHHIHLKDGAEPFVAHTPIPIPHHWKKEVKRQLDEDVARGILRPVPAGEPTEWCFRMVTVPKKDGKPRRTVDFQPGNKACLRETHHTPPPFDMVSSIPPNSYKTVLDAFNGYHQVMLDEESRRLTTFITEYGRYQYLRTPQGHCSAGDAYTKRYDDIVAGVERQCKCIDDTLLHDADIEQAFFHTFDYLKLCGSNGVTLNPDKFKFCRREVEFVGYFLGWEDYRPTGDKLSAIKNFPMPEQPSITDIRSWFGLVNQLAPFLAVSPLMEPFRDLLKPGASKKVYWDQNLQTIFNKTKEAVCSMAANGLAYFDRSRPTAVVTDWSRNGIGFVILQQHCSCASDQAPFCCTGGWKLALCGSRHLSSAEANYSAVEGEALAVAWCFKKARLFLLGNPGFLLLVDHRPLVKILGDRALGDISNPRLLRLKEKTLLFDYRIKHLSGKKNLAADTLSRYPVGTLEPDSDDTDVSEDLEALGAIVAALTSTSEDVIAMDPQHVKNAAQSDEQYQLLSQKVSSDSFAATRAQEDPLVRDFFNVRDRLCIVDDLLMYSVDEKDLRLVIPRKLRRQIISNLHAAHQGSSSMLARARQVVYWPGLEHDVQDHARHCEQCRRHAPSQQREPLLLSPAPDYPFQQVVADMFELNGNMYLSYADRLTGWLEVHHFRSAVTSEALCGVFRQLFHRWGTPEELSSDGGPNLSGRPFQLFLRKWGVRWRLSSAHYPQSNGRAEAAVKTAKRIIRDNTGRGGHLNTDEAAQALLMYRNTPLRDGDRSPAQLALGRHLRDSIPSPSQRYKLSPEWCRDLRRRELSMVTRGEKSKAAYDVGTKQLSELSVGDSVLCQDARTKVWDRRGVIVEKSPFRKYLVKMQGTGRVTIRNRRHLKLNLQK